MVDDITTSGIIGMSGAKITFEEIDSFYTVVGEGKHRHPMDNIIYKYNQGGEKAL